MRDIPDQTVMAVALIENIQREDLNPIEEAMALQRLMQEFELTHQEVAEAVGKSRTTVTNLLRLLSLTTEVKELLSAGKLEIGHAKVLLAVSGQLQTQLAKQAALHGLTVRETEVLVKNALEPQAKTKLIQSKDPNIRSLEQDLAEKLGAKVEVKHGAQGRGKVVINYHSLDELEGILSHIR